MKEVIEKLNDQIDVKPLLCICNQHTNDTFKLKNNLKTKEMRLIAFKKKFDKYSDLKSRIESALSHIDLSLENETPNQKIVDNKVRICNCLQVIFFFIIVG